MGIADAAFEPIVPEYSVVKSTVSNVGILRSLFFATDIADNYATYTGPDLLIANTIDCASFGIGTIAGMYIGSLTATAFVGSIGLPAVAVVALSIIAGWAIGRAFDGLKSMILEE